MTNIAIQNAGILYINRLKLSYISTTSIGITDGDCRNSTNVNDIIVNSALVVDGANNGVNGLDQGDLANGLIYCVYAIGDSTQNNSPAGILSTDTSSPVLPFGYDMFRLIGHVKTDGSAHILPFVQTGDGATRRFTYDTLITVLTAGNATSFTNVDCSASVPATAKAVVVQCAYTPATAGTNQLKLRCHGSSSTNGSAQANGTVNSVVSQSQLFVPVSAGIFEYLVSNGSDAATVYLSSYDDEL
jgi:hypothetical protein